MEATFAMLNVPKNSSVTIYNSGCGMAGSFGYEKIMKSVCKWVKIPYFLKLELLIPQQLLQQLARVVATRF
jgi:hypothetical protein